ncbi:MAG: hypothetical protein GY862_09410, partial [Gammaproteobacteria bacterium]|nr:hypothetical protein [Gammaproteobacteria bacterium]
MHPPGMLGVDAIADAFKEFRLRVMSGEKAVIEGLDSMGISSASFTASLSDGSLSASDAFQQVVSKLNDIDDPMLRMQAGAAVIGTKFEDAGDAAFAGLNLAKTSIDDLAGGMDSLQAVNETASVKFTSLWRTAVTGAGDMFEPFMRYAGDAADFLNEKFTWFFDNVSGLSIVTAGAVSEAWERFNWVFDSVINAGKHVFGGFASFVLTQREGIIDNMSAVAHVIPGMSDLAGSLDFATQKLHMAASGAKNRGRSQAELNAELDSGIASIQANTQAALQAVRDEKTAAALSSDSIRDLSKVFLQSEKAVSQLPPATEKAGAGLEKLSGKTGTGSKKLSELEKAAKAAAGEVSKVWESLAEREATALMDEASASAWELAEAMLQTGQYTEDQIEHQEKAYEARLRTVEAAEDEFKAQTQLTEQSQTTLENLEKELSLLQIGDEKIRDRVKFLQDVSPELQDQAGSLYDQVEAQKEVNRQAKQMKSAYESAFKDMERAGNSFFDRIIDGASFKDSFKVPGKDLLKSVAHNAVGGIGNSLMSGIASQGPSWISGIGNTISGWFGGGAATPAAPVAAVASGASGTDWGGIFGGVANLAGSFLSARNSGGGGVCCDGGSPVVKTLRMIETTIKAGNLLMDVGNKIQDALARNIDVGEFGKKGLAFLGSKLTGVSSLADVGANSQAAMLAAQTSEFGNFGAEMTREALTGTANATGIFSEAAQSVKDAFEPVTKLWDSATGKITGMMSEAEAAAGEFAAET